MRIHKSIGLFTALLVGASAWLQTVAQTTSPGGTQEPRKPVAATRINPVIVQSEVVAPQVVTILHRLNGLKVFRLLSRSQEQFGAIANIDEAFKIAGDVHTNVIAGLTLDDGQTIAAWLPEAEAEMPPPIPQAPRPPEVPGGSANQGQIPHIVAVPQVSAMTMAGHQGLPLTGNLLGPADLKIITRDGKRLMGRYIGLDGLTGLSVISLTNSPISKVIDAKEQPINVGQRLRLIGPEPASHSEPGARSAMYVRIGETEAIVVSVSHSPSGGVARVNIKSTKLTPANIGGIVLNDTGETIGIVDAVQGVKAAIVPVSIVRNAVKRVIERQASVPRPWLGIKGEPIRSVSLDRMLGVGWERERARALAEKREGIMLTFVRPSRPRWDSLVR